MRRPESWRSSQLPADGKLSGAPLPRIRKDFVERGLLVGGSDRRREFVEAGDLAADVLGLQSLGLFGRRARPANRFEQFLQREFTPCQLETGGPQQRAHFVRLEKRRLRETH